MRKGLKTMFKCTILLIAASVSLCSQSHEALSRRKRSELLVDLPTFRKQNLDCHNKYREQHGIRALAMSDKLNKISQEHANFLAKQDSYPVISGNGYNELIHQSKGYKVDGNSACDSWYLGEGLNDNSADNTTNLDLPVTGLQMISRSHCFLGIGVAKSKSGSIYVVGNYDPLSDIRDEFSRNLTPLEALTMNPSCTDADRQTYLKQNLDCQNLVRRMYGAPALIYKEEMNKYAEMQADWLAKDEPRRPLKGYNSYNEFIIGTASNNTVINGYRFCKHIYEEGKIYGYDFYTGLDNKQLQDNPARSFTQMIWKSTRFTGFGMARSKSGKVYGVFVYDPSGNVRGQYRTNLVPVEAWTSGQVHTTSPTITRQTTTSRAKTPRTTTLRAKTPQTTTSTTILPERVPLLDETFRKQNLFCHNEYRLIHNVEPLAYTPELMEYAQNHAEWLAKKDKDGTTAYDAIGFNVYTTTQDEISGLEACAYWYLTGELYDYEDHGFSAPQDTFPFTSMVWKHSRSTGIGLAKSYSGKIYVTAVYDPRGNSRGEFGLNVLPPVVRDDPANHRSLETLLSNMFRISSDPKIESVAIDVKQFYQQNLDCHNNLRNRYGAPPLTYNDQLMHSAKKTVEFLAERDDNSLENKSFNYFVTDSLAFNGYTACKKWYSGYKWYKHNNVVVEESKQQLIESYQRMTWRGADKMGCGLTFLKSKFFFVCQYHPLQDVIVLTTINDAGSFKMNLLHLFCVFLVQVIYNNMLF